jgi:exopolyphosphatase/pppGpp-phosphohydrolase
LGSILGLTEHEQRLLDWAALFHDVGNGATTVYGVSEKEAREQHHEFSARMIREWATQGLFREILSDEDVLVIADLCLRHRKKMPLPEESRMRLVCIILRVADGMDIDARRAQRNDSGQFFEDLDLPEESLPHWIGHRAIMALRIQANAGLTFEFVVTSRQDAAFQVAELTKELAPLTEVSDWTVRVVEVG